MPGSWLRSQNLLFFVYCIAEFDYSTANPVSKELWNFSILFLAIFIASTDSSASLIFAFKTAESRGYVNDGTRILNEITLDQLQ